MLRRKNFNKGGIVEKKDLKKGVVEGKRWKGESSEVVEKCEEDKMIMWMEGNGNREDEMRIDGVEGGNVEKKLEEKKLRRIGKRRVEKLGEEIDRKKWKLKIEGLKSNWIMLRGLCKRCWRGEMDKEKVNVVI